uniref:Pleckstrin homology domain-containing family M member 3 n=1 Tax=Noccaea caerulescens TaxID=107243 RepID=A0A1J3DVH1_NOCCA
MINGEDTREESSRVASLEGIGGDASPVSSLHYSSCGESEFERYCSANSAMGTPSMCSSTGPFHDSLESEFGSFKGKFLSGDATDFENFSLGPSLIRIGFSDEGGSTNGYYNERVSGAGETSNGKVNTTNMIRKTGFSEDLCDGLMGAKVCDDGANEKDSMNQLSDVDENEFLCGSESQFRKSGIDREDGSSVNDEHSDGDDSLPDTGDHSRKSLCFPQNLDNPFLINSSTAFGTNDWDEFELEATELVDTQFDFSGFEEREGTSTKSFSAALQKLPDAAQAGTLQEQINVTVSTRHAPDVGDFSADIEDILRSRDSTILTQREKGGIARDSITVRGSGDLSTEIKTLVVPRSLVKEESIRDSCLGKNETGDKPVVMNYLQSCGADDVLDITPIELGNEDSSGGVHDLDGQVHESFENAKQTNPYGDTSESLLASCNSDKPSSRDSHPVIDALQVTYSQPKKENTELNDFYDDFVHDMEEILLDSGESSGARYSKSDKMFQLQLSLPNRDGGQTATTSGLDDSSPIVSQRFRIDRVEVVGVKQKKGDVSLSERLVGVKEYTIYVIRVWSGKDNWEIERRYRDFYSLYRRLTSLFADQGWTLPTPWASVEKESRKIFGTSPSAVSERTVLIQDCLNSVLQSRYFPALPNALLRFLSPQDASSSGSDSIMSPTSSAGNTFAATNSSYGNTISLIVDIRPHKSVKQLLEAQHYICAGCHIYFDDGATLVRDFVKALGWGKPRLCEYTGQLFCSSCHTNDMAVLPARVLHHWDFNRYPVSQLAKSYLDSIHEQPMLCVSAVNPFLSSKVPALNHIMGIRKRITIMLPYVRCPFRKTLNRGLGSRRCVLESTDFFALRDLIDLSKGPFAALPAIVETVRRKILEHITEQCLVCCDVGISCNARQACDDTSSLIFPFQEDDVKKCRSCGSVFHKRCFSRLSNCHCGAQLNPKKSSAELQVSEKKADSVSVLPLRFLSGLFGKTKKDKETTILMGSLQTNDL